MHHDGGKLCYCRIISKTLWNSVRNAVIIGFNIFFVSLKTSNLQLGTFFFWRKGKRVELAIYSFAMSTHSCLPQLRDFTTWKLLLYKQMLNLHSGKIKLYLGRFVIQTIVRDILWRANFFCTRVSPSQAKLGNRFLEKTEIKVFAHFNNSTATRFYTKYWHLIRMSYVLGLVKKKYIKILNEWSTRRTLKCRTLL